jgi:hypothetical protein
MPKNYLTVKKSIFSKIITSLLAGAGLKKYFARQKKFFVRIEKYHFRPKIRN